ncbi:MAG: hypothetical protein Q4G13_00310 [Moraxella sp.]|nr:hypothetical protein [Moraxella sp.]
MIASTNYVAVVDGQLVAHLAVSTRPALVEARTCRLVVMPEWQGAGHWNAVFKCGVRTLAKRQ